MNSEKQANLIKVAAVVSSATRWIGALAASEGLYVPAEWIPAWRVLSFVMAGAMAAVEAMAFSYALRAWRYMRPDSPQAKRMMGLIVLAAATFVAVMTPSIVAYVQHTEIDQVLFGVGLWVWGVAVTLSTIVVLMMVGYAQGRMAAPAASNTKADTTRYDVSNVSKSYTCADCGESFEASHAYAIHRRWAHRPSKNGQQPEEVETADRPTQVG